jgi:hypothetical protein
MGRLGQSLNTFWQLFYRAAGATTWRNEVQATAVATNGGLVLASDGAGLLAGVRPSNLLTYSPLIATDDAGRSWSTGLLPSGLLSRPDALAYASPSASLALTGAAGGEQVLQSTAGISSWSTATSESALAASSAGKACGVGQLTAVAQALGQQFLGTSCSRPGELGVFVRGATGAWELDPAPVPAIVGSRRAEVLGLEAAGPSLRALLYLSGPGGPGLVAAQLSDGHWSASALLAMGPGESITSFGASAGGGSFVLLTGAAAGERLAVTARRGGAWSELPAPPQGTATVVAGAGGVLQALAVDEEVMTVWSLAPGAGAWKRGQVVHVAIEYGSSE